MHLVMRTLRVYSPKRLPYASYSSVNSSHHATHHISSTYLSYYNCKCVPLATFLPCPLPHTHPTSGNLDLCIYALGVLLGAVVLGSTVRSCSICPFLPDLFLLSVMPTSPVHVTNGRTSCFMTIVQCVCVCVCVCTYICIYLTFAFSFIHQ